MKNRIYLCLAHMNGKEQQFIQEAFDANWVAPLGPNVQGFEEDLKAYLGKEVVALSSGTAAVHLALLACGVQPGDEVLVQSFTFCASANPVVYLGAIPVFVDSETETGNMDPQLLEEAIKDRIAQTGKKPKAIVPVHLYGMPAGMEEIMAISRQYEIPVIEDAAEALGSTFDGKYCGTFGTYGVLSFNGNKMITTSGGGALICPHLEAKQRVKFFATQSREECVYYNHLEIGYNYRMSNICAGIGRGQMTVLSEHIAHHKQVQSMYEMLLANVKGIRVHSQPKVGSPCCEGPRYDSNYWLSTLLLDPSVGIKGQDKVYPNGQAATDCVPNANVEALRVWMDERGVEVRPLWKPLHKQPVYAKNTAYANGVSEGLFRTGLCLPAGPCVTQEDVQYIVQCIKEAIA